MKIINSTNFITKKFSIGLLSNYYVKDDRKSVILRKQNDRLIIFLCRLIYV